MRKRLLCRFLLVCALVAPVAGAYPGAAQQAPAQGVQNAPAANQNGTFLSQHAATSQNLARAEQEDEEYVFRHSSSVRFFGKLFHLDPEAASMSFWGLNFVILAVLVGLALYKGLPKAFRSRRDLIQRQLVEARTATEQANQRLRAVEERLARLDGEIASLRDASEREAARDEERVKASIEEERRKIVAASEQEVAAAGAAAERRLRRFAAELAIERAAARIHLTEEDDRNLIHNFAGNLPYPAQEGDGSNGRRGGRG